ncbi:MAG: MurR/RpiR family transcriptional regulator [Oscillospiraceae bacterium]
MDKDLFVRLEKMMPKMSKGHKLIANYILTHYDKAAYMTAQKLGKVVGVSESTVVRFASEIGFEGYPELQHALKELMRNKLTAVQRIEVSSDQMTRDNVLDRVLSLDIDRIKYTLEHTSKDDFNDAVDKIIGCNAIYIIGARSAAPLASFLHYYFNMIFPQVKLIKNTTTSELLEQVMHIGKNDVIIGISFPRYSKQTAKILQYASSSGAHVIAITDSMDSPLVQYANNMLLAKSDMASLVDSLVAPLSLINALIAAVTISNVDKVTKSFGRLEEIWSKYDVYEKNEELNS